MSFLDFVFNFVLQALAY